MRIISHNKKINVNYDEIQIIIKGTTIYSKSYSDRTLYILGNYNSDEEALEIAEAIIKSGSNGTLVYRMEVIGRKEK
jgi:hypothetical protein